LAILEDCANCCRLVIDIAKSVLRVSGQGVNINGAWWLSAHFVFNASLVLLGVNLAIRHSNSHSSQPQPSNSLIVNRKSIDDAAAVMQSLDRGNAVIAGCRTVLISFTKLYDTSGVFRPAEPSMGTRAPELQAPMLGYQNRLRDNEIAAGSSTGMGSLFDEFAAFSTFNFFSDTSHYN